MMNRTNAITEELGGFVRRQNLKLKNYLPAAPATVEKVGTHYERIFKVGILV
jgi:hypothetical protein